MIAIVLLFWLTRRRCIALSILLENPRYTAQRKMITTHLMTLHVSHSEPSLNQQHPTRGFTRLLCSSGSPSGLFIRWPLDSNVRETWWKNERRSNRRENILSCPTAEKSSRKTSIASTLPQQDKEETSAERFLEKLGQLLCSSLERQCLSAFGEVCCPSILIRNMSVTHWLLVSIAIGIAAAVVPFGDVAERNVSPTKPELKFLTVWIAPQTHHSAMKHLRKIIRETGGPVFPPHVTLLPLLNSTYSDWADIQPILSDISVAAGGPLDLQFYDMKVKDNFYQSIILEAVQTEDLMKLGQSVADQLGERYGAKDIPPYYPHTSLFYGTHTPEIVDRVTQMVDDYKLINTTIRFDRMDVWATPDTIEEWRYLGEFSSLKSVAHDVTGYWKLGEAKLRRVCYRLESLNRSSRIASTSYSCLPSITGAPLQIS
ncbi:hypothetical protein PROFUN_07161 [Planoprotostelium fungivorum]|uniref:Uncharacterized protein n=1 Tax=Planoprotostelium fungivorum TaxID=1890364 RepID=A0A2P6NMA5_9EUKA|nr:hypothetical protein PROFUN_07161 [Planoprotostelium fungivorum]